MMGINIGPNIPATDPTLKPIPRTTVGNNSEANNGRTTYDEDIPIFPMQYSISTKVCPTIKNIIS